MTTTSSAEGSRVTPELGAAVQMIIDRLPGPLRRVRVEIDGSVVEVEWNTDVVERAAPAGRELVGAVSESPRTPPPDASREVTASVVGTFYGRPSPDAPPFVQVGDAVEAGQQVAVIETMKLFTQVTVERAGLVMAVCAKDGEMVEFGQCLFELAADG